MSDQPLSKPPTRTKAKRSDPASLRPVEGSISKPEQGSGGDGPEGERLALEWERLRLERQKLALEFQLKRRETQRKGLWKELLANPAMVAIVGGLATLMTTIAAAVFTANANLNAETFRSKANLDAETSRARLTRENAQQTLQADLIKKFVEGPRTEAVRENLRFLADAGLIPEYADRIKSYLDNNPGSAPQVSSNYIGGIVGVDDRVALAKAAPDVQASFQGIGLILLTTSEGLFRCTGFLVAPGFVVTLQRCLSDNPLGKPLSKKPPETPQSATFEPLPPASSASSVSKPLAIDLTRLVFVPLSSDDGIAIAPLQDPIDTTLSYLLLDQKPATEGQLFRMAFFALDKNGWVYSTGSDCRVTQVETNELRHLCDTGGGASGAPLLSESGRVIAVHAGSGEGSKRAFRIDKFLRSPDVQGALGQLPPP